MVNGTLLEKEPDRLCESTADVNSIQLILNSYLNPHSFSDEIDEFFREIAALRGESVENTIEQMKEGTRKYLEAVDTKISFEDDLPSDINLYVEKLEKLAVGIELCWDLFSDESRQFFINWAYQFTRQANSKFLGFQGFMIQLKLLIPSLKTQENLYKKYKDSFLLIPKAVDRAIELRKSKSTSQLWITAQTLLKQVKTMNVKQPSSLLPYLKHLGRTPEEQLEKNQAAMAWAKSRLQEIEDKRNGNKI
jgi:hypothetical protein